MSEVNALGDPLFGLPMLVPGSTEYTRLQVPPEATMEEIRAAAGRRLARLRERGASEEEIAVANSINLENAEVRAKYDARFPPLPLLRIEPTWESVLDDRDDGLTVLRREIESFLTAVGESVHYPMDTTRTDFTADFTHIDLLDGPAGRLNP